MTEDVKYRNCYVVYFHRNPISNMVFYVGMGSSENRAKSMKARNIRWLNYIKKYGKPIIEIYKTNLSIIEATALETHFIKLFGRRRIDKNGILVNMKYGSGGMSGLRHSTETRSKISKAFSGRMGVNYGKKQTEEAKRNMSLAKLGKKQSQKDVDARKQKLLHNRDTYSRLFPFVERIPYWTHKDLSSYQCKYKMPNAKTCSRVWKEHISKANIGKKRSKEICERMSKTRLERGIGRKKVIDIKTNNEYNSVKEAAIGLRVSVGLLYNHLSGYKLTKKVSVVYAHKY